MYRSIARYLITALKIAYACAFLTVREIRSVCVIADRILQYYLIGLGRYLDHLYLEDARAGQAGDRRRKKHSKVKTVVIRSRRPYRSSKRKIKLCGVSCASSDKPEPVKTKHSLVEQRVLRISQPVTSDGTKTETFFHYADSRTSQKSSEAESNNQEIAIKEPESSISTIPKCTEVEVGKTGKSQNQTEPAPDIQSSSADKLLDLLLSLNTDQATSEDNEVSQKVEWVGHELSYVSDVNAKPEIAVENLESLPIIVISPTAEDIYSEDINKLARNQINQTLNVAIGQEDKLKRFDKGSDHFKGIPEGDTSNKENLATDPETETLGSEKSKVVRNNVESSSLVAGVDAIKHQDFIHKIQREKSSKKEDILQEIDSFEIISTEVKGALMDEVCPKPLNRQSERKPETHNKPIDNKHSTIERDHQKSEKIMHDRKPFDADLQKQEEAPISKKGDIENVPKLFSKGSQKSALESYSKPCSPKKADSSEDFKKDKPEERMPAESNDVTPKQNKSKSRRKNKARAKCEKTEGNKQHSDGIGDMMAKDQSRTGSSVSKASPKERNQNRRNILTRTEQAPEAAPSTQDFAFESSSGNVSLDHDSPGEWASAPVELPNTSSPKDNLDTKLKRSSKKTKSTGPEDVPCAITPKNPDMEKEEQVASKMRLWRKHCDEIRPDQNQILMEWINERKLQSKHAFDVTCTQSHGESSPESSFKEESSPVRTTPRKSKRKKQGKSAGQKSDDSTEEREAAGGSKSPNFIWLKNEGINTTRFRYDTNCENYSWHDFSQLPNFQPPSGSSGLEKIFPSEECSGTSALAGRRFNVVERKTISGNRQSAVEDVREGAKGLPAKDKRMSRRENAVNTEFPLVYVPAKDMAVASRGVPDGSGEREKYLGFQRTLRTSSLDQTARKSAQGTKESVGIDDTDDLTPTNPVFIPFRHPPTYEESELKSGPVTVEAHVGESENPAIRLGEVESRDTASFYLSATEGESTVELSFRDSSRGGEPDEGSEKNYRPKGKKRN